VLRFGGLRLGLGRLQCSESLLVLLEPLLRRSFLGEPGNTACTADRGGNVVGQSYEASKG